MAKTPKGGGRPAPTPEDLDGPRGHFVRVQVDSNFTGVWETILMTRDRPRATRIVAALVEEGLQAQVSCGCGSYPDGECELCTAEATRDRQANTNLPCRIVTMTWTEPSDGVASQVWAMTEQGWRDFDAATAWVKEQQGVEVGHTIVEVTTHGTFAIGSDQIGDQVCMEALATQVRYSGAELGLYATDCPQFAKYGIRRDQ